MTQDLKEKIPKRVFIVQRLTNIDYSSANDLGDDVISIMMDYFKFTHVENTLNRIRKFTVTARKDDILLVSGHAFLNMLALTAWFERFPSCNIAVHDRESNSYKVYVLDNPVRNIETENESL